MSIIEGNDDVMSIIKSFDHVMLITALDVSISLVCCCLGTEGMWLDGQALLSRGDRRLSPLLLRVREHGDTLGSFRRAFKEMQGELPPMDYYVHAPWAVGNAILPWTHLHGPLPESTLVKHAKEAVSHMGKGFEQEGGFEVSTPGETTEAEGAEGFRTESPALA
jgi:hypothetical protein